jgi:hypothetical protein
MTNDNKTTDFSRLSFADLWAIRNAANCFSIGCKDVSEMVFYESLKIIFDAEIAKRIKDKFNYSDPRQA